MKLQNKVALITGASGGIGKETALLFAQEGATVVVNYLSSQQDAHHIVDEIKHNGADALTIECDVSRAADVHNMIDTIIKTYGRIDILVNNAGVLIPIPFDEVTVDVWNKTIDSNLIGTFNCIQAVSKHMKSQKFGKIVNISSIASIVGSLSSAPYAISKAGIDSLTKTLAPEFGKFGITINSVAPGPVATDLMTKNYGQAIIEKLSLETPMGRIAQPHDIAKVVLFFSSSDSDFVNGQTLIVDGGRIIR